jgi:hypothetical protein
VASESPAYEERSRAPAYDEASRAPAADAPVPEWKRADWACDVLPAGDPAAP